ncbi:MAG: von Willebrand factor type A domain-containing protein [Sphingobacteriaceae bacterium]|nr:von Willebrand factor type A domain-containing protein [Sphingobacteriaceae bacterium]
MKKIIFTLHLLLIMSIGANALTFNKVVTGIVKDSKTKAILAGVRVAAVPPPHVRMKMISAITDSKGKFSLSVPDFITTISFDRKGYAAQQVAITISKPMIVSLVAQKEEQMVALKLEQVNSVMRIEAKDLHEMSGMATNQVLKGKVAGLSIRGYNFNKVEGSQMYNTESYTGITENRFLTAKQNPLSTFGIDVDAASYSNIRRYVNNGNLPPVDAVRIEEMVNYFTYQYPQPKSNDPFSVNTEISKAPWNQQHKLVRIGLQGRKVAVENLPSSNLVFLIDVSGSMNQANKLPLVKSSMKLLVDQLREKDKVAIVVYAGAAGLVLPATSGDKKQTIKNALDALESGGSTAGGEGIKLAYKIALENFVKGGNNRVILASDGDFNIGVSSDGEMQRLIEEKRESGVFLTVLGYGMGNYKDSKMETIANKGNGNYAYIDNLTEARKVLVNEFGGTLFTIAKDVKLQIEFNPTKVQSYRLIGYENRLLNKEDFNNDKKDAGDLGSGHTVTALYEIIPTGVKSKFNESVDDLKYQSNAAISKSGGDELFTVKLRYKQPDHGSSKLIEKAVKDSNTDWENTSGDFRFAASVAAYGMLLRNSEFLQDTSYDKVIAWAKSGLGQDEEGYRNEFLQLVKTSALLSKEKMATKVIAD